jgi:hypothetical protein
VLGEHAVAVLLELPAHRGAHAAAHADDHALLVAVAGGNDLAQPDIEPLEAGGGGALLRQRPRVAERRQQQAHGDTRAQPLRSKEERCHDDLSCV